MTAKPRARIATRAIALGLSLGGLAASLALPTTPARAILVFDPSNYSQNVLTAARTLQQINNQIRSLQNQAQSLVNEAKNLTTIDFPELREIGRKLQAIDMLMEQAKGIRFRIASLDREFSELYPDHFDATLKLDQQVASARSRLAAAFASYRETMRVQAEVVGNIHDDASVLEAVMTRSQASQGALQVGQATNQLLALTAKQQFQIQELMAAQYRAQATEQANRSQARAEARAATAKFLGSGSAYTPD